MNSFQEQLKIKMDDFVHRVYEVSKKFPKEELFGTNSQLRRASLSIILNYIEGFAREKTAVKKNFWEISYGSLQESKYLIRFCSEENYLSRDDYNKLIKSAEEIGAMLWRAMRPLK